MSTKKTFVIALGGSLIVPNAIDTDFIKSFRDMIFRKIDEDMRFIIVAGGGDTARQYVKSAEIIDPTMMDSDKDWIGIHATRLNAHLLRTIFRTIAHPKINDNPHNYEVFRDCAEPVVIASGWRPGFSTDFDAVLLGHNLGSKTVINLSNIDYIYDKDPNKNDDAKKKENLTWRQYRELVGNKWIPGMHAPFDPIAAQFAQKHDMTVVITQGLNNIEIFLDTGNLCGTQIKE